MHSDDPEHTLVRCVAKNFKEEYDLQRANLVVEESRHAWDRQAIESASKAEIRASSVLLRIREHERRYLFGNLPGEAIPSADSKDMGGRFLINKPLISEQSRLFDITRHMPKGCHLHVHFNSELPPEELLTRARSLPKTMFIRSTQPLVTVSDFDDAEIVFNVMPESTVTGNIYSKKYNPRWKESESASWMTWAKFRQRFPSWIPVSASSEGGVLDRAERWAREKVMVTVNKAYGIDQTHNGYGPFTLALYRLF